MRTSSLAYKLYDTKPTISSPPARKSKPSKVKLVSDYFLRRASPSVKMHSRKNSAQSSSVFNRLECSSTVSPSAFVETKRLKAADQPQKLPKDRPTHCLMKQDLERFSIVSGLEMNIADEKYDSLAKQAIADTPKFN